MHSHCLDEPRHGTSLQSIPDCQDTAMTFSFAHKKRSQSLEQEQTHARTSEEDQDEVENEDAGIYKHWEVEHLREAKHSEEMPKTKKRRKA